MKQRIYLKSEIIVHCTLKLSKMNINIKRLSILSIFAFLGLTACKNDAKKEVAIVEAIPGIVMENMDTSVKPNDDFFRHVNGSWLDTNEIPSDRTRWGSFDELRKSTDADALAILKSAMSDNKDLEKIDVLPGSDQEKAVHLYETIMDTVSRDEQGINPIKSSLERINNIQNIDDLQKLLIAAEPHGGIGFFGFGVGSHPKNSNINAGYLGNGALGLSRDYYVDEDDDTKEKREKYRAHIAKMLRYIGDSEEEAAKNADIILAFETRLAKPRMTKEDRRDARKRFNPKSMDDLSNLASSIDWKAYFEGIGVKEIDTVIVTDPGYYSAMDAIFKENNIEDWKQYLRWTLIDGSASLLSTEIDKENWNFYSKELRGSKKQRPREEIALGTLNGSIGEALGKLYVDKKFPPEAKEKAAKMIENIMLAFDKRIENLEWMTAETKAKAKEKLQKMNVKIAYPDVWKDYKTLDVKSTEDGGSYFSNIQNVRAWNFNDDLEKLGERS